MQGGQLRFSPVLSEGFPFVTMSLCARPHVLSPMVGEGKGGMCWGGHADIPLCVPPREAIGLVCEAVPGAKGAVRRRKVRGCRGGQGALRGRSDLPLRAVVPVFAGGGSRTCPIPTICVPPQPCGRSLNSILGKSNLKFAGMAITLTISTSSLNLMATDCKQVSAGRCRCPESSAPQNPEP